MILVTGGAGFIGANFILEWLASVDEPIVNLDALTYAGNAHSLKLLQDDSRYTFVNGDVCDKELMRDLLLRYKPRAIIHFAAESHVDRSILGPAAFIRTNVEGTFSLLEATRGYLDLVSQSERHAFRFVHISTDEVYGSLREGTAPFTESHSYEPNSPYAASKAASDHLVRAWHHTFGVPTITTNCSNNYGPLQFPEKLIPLMIVNALAGKSLPIYGDGLNVRDWLFVSDHCRAIRVALDRGKVGETYNVGGWNEMTNLEVVRSVCSVLNEMRPDPAGAYERLIVTVKDRPGHDRRYAIDSGKIERELHWRPSETFTSGIRKTVRWYLDNPEWIASVQSGTYREWINMHYGNRVT